MDVAGSPGGPGLAATLEPCWMRPGEVVGSERQGERESGEMASLGCRPHAHWGFIRSGARCGEDPADSRPTAGLGPGLQAGRNGGLRGWNRFS